MQDFLDWKVPPKLVCSKLNNWHYQLKENQTLVTWENPFWTKGFQCRVEQRQVHGQLLMLQKVYIYIQTCPIMSTLVESCLFLSNPVYSCRILSILFHVVQLQCPWAIINAWKYLLIFISKDRFFAAKRSQRQLQEPFFALLHTETVAEGKADFEV